MGVGLREPLPLKLLAGPDHRAPGYHRLQRQGEGIPVGSVETDESSEVQVLPTTGQECQVQPDK